MAGWGSGTLHAFATVVEQVSEEATCAGRHPNGFEHGTNAWCGFGDTRQADRGPLAAGMETSYQMPFEPFERYSPYGTPEEVADFLRQYIDAGCWAFNVIPCASDEETTIAAVGELCRPLAAAMSRPRPSVIPAHNEIGVDI